MKCCQNLLCIWWQEIVKIYRNDIWPGYSIKEPSSISNCASWKHSKSGSLSLKIKIKGDTLSEEKIFWPLHVGRCMLRAQHSETFLDHLVELRIHWHSRVGAASWGTNGLQISVNHKQAATDKTFKRFSESIKVPLAGSFYLRRTAPIEKYHRTTHHFQMCIHSWKCFQVPSISQVAEPVTEAQQIQQC